MMVRVFGSAWLCRQAVQHKSLIRLPLIGPGHQLQACHCGTTATGGVRVTHTAASAPPPGHDPVISISTPIFYVNGAPHIGHAYTSILADCLSRWHKLIGNTVLFSTGTDEHGIKVQQAAQKEGIPPIDFCDTVSQQFRDMIASCGVEPTCFIRTSDKAHIRAVVKFWEMLQSNGMINRSRYSGWYSTTDECFYSERQVTTNSAGEKIAVETGSSVEHYEEDNYTFRMSMMTEKVRAWLDKAEVKCLDNQEYAEFESVFPASYKNQLYEFLDAGLPDLSISRSATALTWGIPVPNDSTHTIYVWVDALVNYLTAQGFPDTRTLQPFHTHVVGKDILKFHALYWPALLIAAGLNPPKRILTHGHWTSEGSKMSKSRGNVVDPFDEVQAVGQEAFRFFLMHESRLGADGDYSSERRQRVIDDLGNTLGNLLLRSTNKRINPQLVYPHPGTIDDALFTEHERSIISQLNDLGDKVATEYHHGQFGLGIGLVMDVLREVNKAFQLREPWNHPNQPQTKAILSITYEAMRIAALFLSPVTPRMAGKIRAKLGLPNPVIDSITTFKRKSTVGGEEDVGNGILEAKVVLVQKTTGITTAKA